MSSTTKDARWQLATDMLQRTKYAANLALLPYPLQEHILGSAQSVLETLTATEVAELAKRWQSDAPERVKMPRERVTHSRLVSLQANNRTYPTVYIIDPKEMDEILELARDGLEFREANYSADKPTEKKILRVLARLIKEEL